MTTLTSLTLGTTAPDFYHALVGGVDKKYTGHRVVNVKDHGALGNGLTDDTASIQNAIDAAYGVMPDTANGQSTGMYDNCELYFPPGDYIVSTPLLLCNTTGAKIYGAGMEATHLHFVAEGDEGNSILAWTNLVPLWCTDGLKDSVFSDMTWSSDVAEPFITKTTNGATSAAGTEIFFADTSDIVIGSEIHNFTDPPSLTVGAAVIAKDADSITIDLPAVGAVDSGDTIYFTTTCQGIYTGKDGARGQCTKLSFRNLRINNFGIGIMNHGGAANAENFILQNVEFNNCSLSGFRTTTFNTLNHGIFGGGAHNCGLATTCRPHFGPGLTPTSGNAGAGYSIGTGSAPTIVGIHTSGNGWGIVTGSTQGQVIIGGLMEDKRAIATLGAFPFISGVKFTGGDDTVGVCYLNAVNGGTIVCNQCTFAPTNPIAPATMNHIGECGHNGIIVLNECRFEGHADECGLDGQNLTSRIKINNCYGSSMPSATTLFADFAGVYVDSYTQLDGCTVADLPTAHAKFKGLRGWVTDANATTFMSTVASGGSNVVRVFCNGTNWVIA